MRILCFPGVDSKKPLTRQQCEVQMAAQGFTVIEIAKEGNTWRLVDDSRYNRRISTNAPMRIAGPAAGIRACARTRILPVPRSFGTFNNCAGGTTPWGTMLTAEENIQNYFSGDASKGPEGGARKRYNITGKGRYADWGRYFDRFNWTRSRTSPIASAGSSRSIRTIPTHTPVKRTALGRCAHECATHAVSHDGRVAIYSGDDARMEYVYNSSPRAVRSARPAANRDLLDHGTLYVARFEANGKMRWLPLVYGQGPLTAANGFTSQADVVIEARRAATSSAQRRWIGPRTSKRTRRPDACMSCSPTTRAASPTRSTPPIRAPNNASGTSSRSCRRS